MASNKVVNDFMNNWFDYLTYLSALVSQSDIFQRNGCCGQARGDHLSAMRHLLFICSRNKLRSPTAEAIFREHPGVETDSAGLADDAEVPLSIDQIEWADMILVMEPIHRTRLNRRFKDRLKGKKIAVLGIADHYGYMDEALIRLLNLKCAPYMP